MMTAVWLTRRASSTRPAGWSNRSFSPCPLRESRNRSGGGTDARRLPDEHDRYMRCSPRRDRRLRRQRVPRSTRRSSLAAETGDEIAAITVWRALQGDFGLAYPSAAMLDDLLDAERKHAEAALVDAAARAEAAGVHIRTRLATGDPAEQICAYAARDRRAPDRGRYPRVRLRRVVCCSAASRTPSSGRPPARCSSSASRSRPAAERRRQRPSPAAEPTVGGPRSQLPSGRLGPWPAARGARRTWTATPTARALRARPARRAPRGRRR